MIGIVFGEYQRFPKQGLPVTVRYFGEKVVRLIQNQIAHLLQVVSKLRRAIIPGFFIRGSRFPGPVTVREFRRNMIGVPAELHNIPLGYTQVFQDLPCGMAVTVHKRSEHSRRYVLYGLFKRRMSVGLSKHFYEMTPQFIIIHIDKPPGFIFDPNIENESTPVNKGFN
jgi:hypothetical protein